MCLTGRCQRQILAALEVAGHALPIHEFADLEEDATYWHIENELAKVRSAVRGLERRGLVHTFRDSDPGRQVKTRIGSGNYLDGYQPYETTRAWSGTWVALARSYDFLSADL
jgi:Asp-tRNA(Asn)/Glu-tRNA(Gln) amidotransferase A subunit family amidase